MKTQFQAFCKSRISASKRLCLNYCLNQPLNKWLLVRHIFDISFRGYIPTRKLFDKMLDNIEEWAKSQNLIVERQTVGDWDFIRFNKNLTPKNPQQ